MKKKGYINIYICIYVVLFLIIPVTVIDAILPKLYDLLKLISVSIMFICIFIKIIKDKKIDNFDLIMFINSIALLIISTLKHTIMYNVAFSIISLFVIPVFVKNSLSKSKNALQALYYLYVAIVLLNSITILYKIKISYQTYFFIGGKNAVSLTIVPAMLIIYIYSVSKYGKLTYFNIAMLMLCIISLIASGSSTAIVIAAIIIMYYFTLVKKINISLKKYIFIYLVIFILIVFGTAILEHTFLNTIIKEAFNKDLTFTNRTKLWEISLEYFLKSPIIGYGKNNTIIYDNTRGMLDQSHNMILQLLLSGGVVSLVLFIITIYISYNKLNFKNNMEKTILFYFFVYSIIGLTESIVFIYQLWMMFSIGYSINKICEINKKDYDENMKEDKYDKKNNFINKKIY